MKRTPILILCLALISLRVGLPIAAAEAARDVVTKNGAVVSVSAEASQVGIETLQRGGNAVDAAVASALALAVTHPQAGNIGGGGFMMIHMAQTADTVCVDYREMAPAAATRDLCERLTPTSRGHVSVGVPGTVRGLALAHAKFGKMPWKKLVAPAVWLAEEGFSVDTALARSLNAVLKQTADYSEFGRAFAKAGGIPWEAGDRLIQKDLAATLRILADDGADAFYTGPVADKLVEEMQAGGGLITKADLAAYEARIRKPVHGNYRGCDVFAPPPPSSGGVALVEMLNILEHFDLATQGRGSAATAHQMIEAMRRAYFDRAIHLGDPAFTDVPVERLISKSYARDLASSIAADRASRSDQLGKDVLVPAEGESTTHFSVIDRDGNAVANTYTLQESYGSYVVVRGAGFLLNNEMTDFNLHPGVTDRSGQIGTDANLVAPHKRMLSSQTPTIVLRDGKVLLVTGSPGGRTIVNTVLHVVTSVIDFEMDLRSAIDAPRLHHQWMPDVVRYEEGRLSAETREQLQRMGHRFEVVGRQGDAHSIWIDPATGLRHGAADRRISGAAAGY